MALAHGSSGLGLNAESGIGKTPPAPFVKAVLVHKDHATRHGMVGSLNRATHGLEIHAKPIRRRH